MGLRYYKYICDLWWYKEYTIHYNYDVHIQGILDLSIDVRYRRLYIVLSPPDVIVAYDIDSDDPAPSDFINTGLGTPRAVHSVSATG